MTTMYNRIPPIALGYPAPPAPVREKPLDLGQLLRFFVSSWLSIAFFTALFGAAALAYVLVTPQTFVTSAQLMLESRQVTSSDTERSFAENALVEAQIEIVKSNDVLRAVIKELDLASDPDFGPRQPSIEDKLRALTDATTWSEVEDILGSLFEGITSIDTVDTGNERAGAPASSSPASSSKSNENESDLVAALRQRSEEQEIHLVAALRQRLRVHRVGQSTVIEVSAASSNPKKAAALANAVAETYLAHNVAMKSQAARQWSEWLAQRVSRLREEVFTADRAVSQFQISGDPSSHYKLAELKSVAETYRRLYETYLLSWSGAKQRISFPVADAVFVSRASVPVAKSYPKSGLIIAFALVLGACSGAAWSIVRRAVNRIITSANRIAAETERPCIGLIAAAGRIRKTERTGPLPELPRVDRRKRTWSVRDESFTRDLKDLQTTIAGLRRGQKANLIGIVGAEAEAGATTIVYNLAVLASAAGSKTLLIDAAAHNPTLSRAFREDGSKGLMEILNDPEAYAEVMGRANPHLTVLSTGRFSGVTPGERIGSDRFAFSFADLKQRFDLILVDLPSIAKSADAKAIAPHLDGTIVVVRHGGTSLDTLIDAVNALREVGAEVFGVVLNAIPAGAK